MNDLWHVLLITAAVVGVWMACFLVGTSRMELRADQDYPIPVRGPRPDRSRDFAKVANVRPITARPTRIIHNQNSIRARIYSPRIRVTVGRPAHCSRTGTWG